MLLLLPLLLACRSEPEVQLAEPVALPDPVTPPAESAGRIGGEPILADPVVLGGIGVDAVRAGLATRQDAVEGCWRTAAAGEPGLAGKVLVRFTIAADGAVAGARVQSTSLRHEATEACVLQQVEQARFPALQSGDKALVTWPFVFPPTS